VALISFAAQLRDLTRQRPGAPAVTCGESSLTRLELDRKSDVLADELRRLGVQFQDRRYGELVFLLRPGWLFSRSDFNGSAWRPRGMHGYDPADPFSDAIFLSNRPPLVPMRTIADIHPWLHSAIGLAPTASPRSEFDERFAEAGSH